jgi:hypothetical protein
LIFTQPAKQPRIGVRHIKEGCWYTHDYCSRNGTSVGNIGTTPFSGTYTEYG